MEAVLQIFYKIQPAVVRQTRTHQTVDFVLLDSSSSKHIIWSICQWFYRQKVNAFFKVTSTALCGEQS